MVKNKSKCGFSWYLILSITSTRHYSFPKHFFELFLHIKRVWNVFERVWRVEAAHLHNAARALSNPSRWVQLSRQRFRFFDIVVKPNRMWLSVVYSFIDNDTRHRSGQNLLRTHSAAPRESTTFWPLRRRVSLSKKLYTTLNHIRFVNYNVNNWKKN